MWMREGGKKISLYFISSEQFRSFHLFQCFSILVLQFPRIYHTYHGCIPDFSYSHTTSHNTSLYYTALNHFSFVRIISISTSLGMLIS